jgi:hypothetical protein
MSIMYLEEFAGISNTPTSNIVAQAAQQPSVVTQTFSFTGTAGVSSAFNTKTNLVRVHADGICSYLFSSAGTSATTANPRLAAGTTEYFSVRPGDKISAVTNT